MSNAGFRFFERFRLLAFLVAFGASFVLPANILYREIQKSFDEVNLGGTAQEFKFVANATIYKGGFWFSTIRYASGRRGSEHTIHRVDFKTGRNESGFEPNHVESFTLITLNDQLYALTFHKVYRLQGSSFVKICDRPDTLSKLNTELFVYDGKITFVVKTVPDGYRLIHLVDDQWVDGQRIVLPQPQQMWRVVPKTDQFVLDPPATGKNAGEPNDMGVLRIRQQGDQCHVLLRFTKGFAGYRNGLQFVQESSDATQNPPADGSTPAATGWEVPPSTGLGTLECDSDGVVLCMTNGAASQFFRRNLDGSWTQIEGSSTKVGERLICDASNKTVWAVEWDFDWQSVLLREIKGNAFQPPALTMQGDEPILIAARQHIVHAALAAWLLHYVLMSLGAWILGVGPAPVTYEYDAVQAQLAHGWRRITAATVDLAIMVGVMTALWNCLTPLVGIHWTSADDLRLGNRLNLIERFASDLFNSSDSHFDNFSEARTNAVFASFIQPIIEYPMFYGLFLSIPIALCCLRTFVEGQWGTTPGKLLLGIRAVKSSLVTLGSIRSLIRTVWSTVDFVLFLTPLPALFFILLSQNHRRIGDFFADSLVVMRGSIRDAEFATQNESADG